MKNRVYVILYKFISIW